MYIDIDRTGQVAQSTKRWDLSQLAVVENLCQLWKLSHKISQELRKLPVTSCLEGQVFLSRPDPTRPLPLPPFLAWFEKRYKICSNCANFLPQKFGWLKVWQKSFPNTTSSSFVLLARALKDRSNICLAHALCHNMGYCNVAKMGLGEHLDGQKNHLDTLFASFFAWQWDQMG